MDETTAYLRELTYLLRWRRLSVREITHVRGEVEAEARVEGRAADQIFGPAHVYAKTFPRGRTLDIGHAVTATGVVVAVIVVIATAFARLILHVHFPMLLSLLVFPAALAWSLVFVFIGAGIGHREFRTPTGVYR